MDKDLKDLEKVFRMFPGIGPRTSSRYAKIYLNLSDREKKGIIEILNRFIDQDVWCSECGNFSVSPLCNICSGKATRNCGLLCIVENFEDIEVIEKTHSYDGLYQVTGGLFDFDQKKRKTGPGSIDLKPILNRIRQEGTREVIFSFKYSVEAQVTIDYLVSGIRKNFECIKFSTLNFGVPAGIDISLLDSQSLGEGIKNRRSYGE